MFRPGTVTAITDLCPHGELKFVVVRKRIICRRGRITDMGVLNAFGALVSALLGAVVMLVFAILSLFVTVFIVDVAAGIAGLEPSDDFILFGATALAGAAIIAGGVGLALPEQQG